jgi:hypothetical protein
MSSCKLDHVPCVIPELRGFEPPKVFLAQFLHDRLERVLHPLEGFQTYRLPIRLEQIHKVFVNGEGSDIAKFLSRIRTDNLSH